MKQMTNINSRYEYIESLFLRNYQGLSVVANTNPILHIVRILLGSVSCKDLYLNKTIHFKTNYVRLPYQVVTNKSQRKIGEMFPDEMSLTDLEKYLQLPIPNNTEFFKLLEVEIIKCLVANNSKKYLESFFYLYRIIEGISYSFPLVYTSKARDYKKSYLLLKKFMLGNNSDGELAFFKKFIKNIYSKEDFYISTIDINFDGISDDAIKNRYYSLIISKCKKKDGSVNPNMVHNFSDESLIIEFTFMGFYELLIEIRNRYFHFLQGSWHDNIDSIEVLHPEEFFKVLIDSGINWVSIIFFEIIKHCFEASDR